MSPWRAKKRHRTALVRKNDLLALFIGKVVVFTVGISATC
jgi:hypothetical protein